MKKSKTEIALIWDAIHGILVRDRNTDTLIDNLNSRMHQAEDFVVQELRESNADMYNKIEDLERMIKTVDDRRIEAVVRADKQDETIVRLLTDMSSLATDYMDLSIKLGNMAKTVDSLEADSEALMLDSVHLYRREKELQAQVDELQTKVNDQAEALERLLTGMENVAKVLTNLDGWMTNVEVILSAFRKST